MLGHSSISSAALSALAFTGAPPLPFSVSVTVVFESNGAVLRTNLSGIRWAFFDQANPSLLSAPVAKGSAATTNSSGSMTVSITGTTLHQGDTGYLVVETSDGLLTFAGLVVTA